MNQEVIALSIVGVVASVTSWRLTRDSILPPLAGWLLRRGQVKWAFRLRRLSETDAACCRD